MESVHWEELYLCLVCKRLGLHQQIFQFAFGVRQFLLLIIVELAFALLLGKIQNTFFQTSAVDGFGV